MELKSRRVHFAGCTTTPDGQWMQQEARNLTDCNEGILLGKHYLIMDRDAKFTQRFRGLLKESNVKAIRFPRRSPKISAHLERFMRSIKSETLSRMIFFGETSLRRATISYLAHYHQERNHQGLSNRIIEPGDELGKVRGSVHCRERLGGTLRYYYRDAA